MVHFLTLYNDPFNAIKNGKKSVEMRLNDERRQNISVGDILVFENIITKEKISVEVLEKNIYKNFFDLYGNYPKTEIGYDVNEIANPNDMLKYYSQEKIDKFGALAIHIKKLEKHVIVFDMDDTLLKNDKTISDYTLYILKTLQNMGHIVVINTARSKYYNSEYFNLIKPDYAILNGGSLIIDKNEDILYKSLILVENIDVFIGDFLKYTNNFSIQTLTDFLTNDEKYKGQNAKYFEFGKTKFDDEVYKIVASFINQTDAYKLAEKYNLEYVPYFNGKFGRLNNKGISKLSGNQNLSEIIDISLEKFIVFGDDFGDLDMIKNAGEGVLMANSHIADKYIDIIRTQYSNDEDGVAKYLAKKFKISAKP